MPRECALIRSHSGLSSRCEIKLNVAEFQSLFEAKAKHGAQIATLTAFGDRRRFPGHPSLTADKFCESLTDLQLRKLGDGWIDFDRIPRHDRFRWIDPAAQLATRLERTLAYGAPLFAPEDAARVAKEFFAMFRVGKVVRLTNSLGPYPLDGGAHYWAGTGSITDCTFDHAYVGMDDAIVGLILLCDED